MIEGLKYTVDDDEIRELFENLLASAMDARTLPTAHPRFVEIIRQMSAVDAKIFKHLAKTKQSGVLEIRHVRSDLKMGTTVDHLSLIGREVGIEAFKLTQMCINNFCALGLAEVDWSIKMIDDEKYYDPIIRDPEVEVLIERIKKRGETPNFRKGLISMSPLGRVFASCCIRAEISPDTVNVTPD